MRVSKRVKDIVGFTGLAISLLAIIVLCICTSTLISKNNELKVQVNELKTAIETVPEEDILILKCVDKKMVFGMTNGISTGQEKNFEVETTYPIVLYQVVGVDGTILQNNFNEYTGTAKQNSFSLEGVTEEVTEIRLSGFDKEGNQIESKVYKFVFLDKEHE